MALETATFINGLVITNPTSSDDVGDGDNHIRLLKSTIKSTFPNITGAVTGTHTAINSAVTGFSSATNANTASTIVQRDASGNFSAGTITAALTGNVSGNVTGNVTGNLTGDVNGNASGSSGSCTGNAATATKWANARTITLSGDTTGSVGLDGSSNVTLSVSVNDDSHAHIIGNVDGLQTALDGKLGSTATATNSDKVDGKHIAVVSSLPSSPDANTIYFVT